MAGAAPESGNAVPICASASKAGANMHWLDMTFPDLIWAAERSENSVTA